VTAEIEFAAPSDVHTTRL